MLIFGSQGREESRGLVADNCPCCQRLRAFVVIDIYEVAHVYFVSMGRGQLRQTLMRCLECRTTCVFDPHKYKYIVPNEEAHYYRDVDELAQRTHYPARTEIHYRCGNCGFHRPTPYRFCPSCGARCS